MKMAISFLLIIVVGIYSVPKKTLNDTKDGYFGLTSPGIVSDSTWAEHSHVAVSPDGKYFFYMRHIETEDFF